MQGVAATPLHAITVEDVALALCDYGQGRIEWFYGTTAEVAGVNRLEAVGERGVLVWDNGQPRHVTLDPPVSTHLHRSDNRFGQLRGSGARWR